MTLSSEFRTKLDWLARANSIQFSKKWVRFLLCLNKLLWNPLSHLLLGRKSKWRLVYLHSSQHQGYQIVFSKNKAVIDSAPLNYWLRSREKCRILYFSDETRLEFSINVKILFCNGKFWNFAETSIRAIILLKKSFRRICWLGVK